MAETGIEWVKNADGSQGRTWNPIRGCTRVSPGCGGPGPHGGCYAEVIAARFSGPGLPYHGIAEMRGGKARWTGKLAFVEEKLTEPLKVRKPTTWFVNSMSDLFHESVPDAWIDRVFAVMALCPQHTFQVLTKRADRMRAYLSGCRERLWQATLATGDKHCSAPFVIPFYSHAGMATADKPESWPLPNVWLGVSAEDQRRADERVPDLLATPAAVQFVSAEPLLGPIDFTRVEAAREADAQGRTTVHPKRINSLTGRAGHYPSPTILHVDSHGVGARLDWIIAGGESGPGARPMHPDWARQIRDACAAAGVAFLFKQHGAWADMRTAGIVEEGPVMTSGGHLLDRMHRAVRFKDGRAANLRGHTFTGHGTDLVYRVGKKAAGRLLDGVEHNGFPEVSRG